MPVVPTTWEAEVGESRELWRWRLQGTQIMPLHSSLNDIVRFRLKKTKQKNSEHNYQLYFCVLAMNDWNSKFLKLYI